MKKPTILAFAGSTREGSFNKKLIKIAVDGAIKAGADVTLIDLRDFPLPLFDEDLEARSGIGMEQRICLDFFLLLVWRRGGAIYFSTYFCETSTTL